MGIPAIAGLVAKIAGPIIVAKLAGKAGTPSLAQVNDLTEAVKQEVAEQIAASPVIRNELNAEAWWQSRVGWGAIIASLGVLLPPALRLFGVDVSESDILRHGDAVLTLAGALYALYGRFWPGLKPLFGGR